MISSYNFQLVALSLAISVCASYTAFDLASRTREVGGRLRLAWLFGGATCLGLGIWSTHYVGMLALHLALGSLVAGSGDSRLGNRFVRG